MKKLIGVALALGVCTSAPAMEYSYRLYGGRVVVDAVGEIEYDENALFRAWWHSLPSAIRRAPPIAWVFDSPGGNPNGAAEIGFDIAAFGANTGVAAGGQCTSACVLMWANGAHKSAAPDSRIGVHNVRIPGVDDDGISAYSWASDTQLAKYLAARGAPASVVGHLVTTEADDVHWLTADELAEWNVHVTY